MRRLFKLLCVVFVSLGIPAVYADEIFVDHAGSGDFLTIQAAIDDPNTGTGDIVTVLQGTYVENIDMEGKAITLRSSDPTDPNVVAITIIDGGATGISSVITCSSGEDPNTIIEGFWVTNGLTNSGAGMYNQGSSPTVRHCIFTANNSNADGGGMANLFNSAPVISDCTFSNNTAVSKGGGMTNYSNSSPTITDCIFSGNTSEDDGGAIANNTSSPKFSRCTFVDNTANVNGGGIYNIYSASPVVSDCTFNGNTANSSGGGMRNYESSPTVLRCTFSGNTAGGGGGGGMLNSKSSSSPTITHCTFSGNTSGGNGGGILNTASSSAVVSFCTFDENTATYSGGGMFNQQYSSTVSHCVFTDNTSDDGGAMYNYSSSSPTITNCTFSGNNAVKRGGMMYNYSSSSPTLINCILWDNSAVISGNEVHNNISDPNFMYCDIQNCGTSAAWDSSLGTDGGGNMDADPLFVNAADGEFFLKSRGGHFTLNPVPFGPTFIEAYSTVTSLCIDAGDPASDVGDESAGNGGRINMGAYGGTVLASRTSYVLPIKGDLDDDGDVDLADFSILAENWLIGTE